MNPTDFPSTPAQWRSRVFYLALPIVFSNLSVPLVGIVDTAVVGHLSDSVYIAAVAVGATIFSSVFWAFGFLRMGTTGFVAQAVGNGDREAVTLALIRSILLALLIACALLLLQYPVRSVAFTLMDASSDIQTLSESYFSIRILGAPAVFINYCVMGALIGMQRTRTAFVLQLVLNGSNIVLDLLFVVVLGVHSDGVAIASVMSEILAALCGLWVLRSHLSFAQWRRIKSRILQLTAIKAMFSVNGNLFLRTLMLTAAFFYFTSQGANFGADVLAANAILLSMFMAVSYGLDGFAHAAEALAGGAYGASDKAAFQQAVKHSSIQAVVTSLIISVIFLTMGSMIIRGMTSIEEVIILADSYLLWVALSPVLSVWSFQIDGIFIGATQTSAMRNAMFISLLAYLGFSQIAIANFANHGLWASIMVFMLFRALTLSVSYPRLLKHFD